jgi:hypothetical protein
MTMLPLREPTKEELVALREYAERKGADWKAKLYEDWWHGREVNAIPDGHLLRRVRNNLGPKWLKNYEEDKC